MKTSAVVGAFLIVIFLATAFYCSGGPGHVAAILIASAFAVMIWNAITES